MITVIVTSRTDETPEICTFELATADGHPLPPFSAGSHIDVEGPTGIVRQYSLSNDEADHSHYVIGVLRDPASRGGSAALHSGVTEGSLLKISEPKNHFPLARDASYSLLLAGGIGVTPMLSMAERLIRIGASFELHYCTRSRERTAFMDRIQRSAYAVQVQHHFDDGPSEQKIDFMALLANPEPQRHLYVCGPKGFMDAALDSARKQGWADAQLHYEFFTGVSAQDVGGDEFDVQIASSGAIFHVAKDQPVTKVLANAGIEIEVSCEQGVCGTCLTRVLSGVPDHKDMFLSPSEQGANNQFMPCCSRSKTPLLVLDL